MFHGAEHPDDLALPGCAWRLTTALPSSERLKLAAVSTHWLHHAFGMRAISREVLMNLIQAKMGHATVQTTTAICGQVDELKKPLIGAGVVPNYPRSLFASSESQEMKL